MILCIQSLIIFFSLFDAFILYEKQSPFPLTLHLNDTQDIIYPYFGIFGETRAIFTKENNYYLLQNENNEYYLEPANQEFNETFLVKAETSNNYKYILMMVLLYIFFHIYRIRYIIDIIITMLFQIHLLKQPRSLKIRKQKNKTLH